MNDQLDLAVVWTFCKALLIGALIGIEREKRKAAEQEAGIGGLRTFVLLALLGAVAGWMVDRLGSYWPLLTALLVVAAAVLSGYVLSARVHPRSLGLTTESAAILTCLLGAMTTLGHGSLAVALGIAVAAVLAYKQPLHGLVDKLGWDDLFAGLRLLIASFIVLPLLPRAPVDPWGALNPHSLWLLVLLISTLSLLGYVATRWLGPGRGTLLTALSGALVSSTAVTLALARQSRRENATQADLLAASMLIAWCIMFGRVAATVLVVNRALVVDLLLPLLATAAVAGLAAGWCLRRSLSRREQGAAALPELPLRNPFSLTEAAKFGAFFALVLLVVKFAETNFPGQGLYLVAVLAGLTDVDAITLSMAEFAKTGDRAVAVNAIVLATLANTAVKCAIAALLGGRAMRGPLLGATGLMLLVGGGWLALS